MRILFFTVVIVFSAVGARAQELGGRSWFQVGSAQGDAPVMLFGNYRFLTQASSRQGTYQEKPPDLWRAELNPTLSLYGIPLTVNLLVSSEQRDIRQNINAFSVTLDPDAVRRIVQQRAYRALDEYARTEAGSLLYDYDNVRDSLAKYDPEQLKQLDEYRKIEEMRDLARSDISSYDDVLTELGLMSDVEHVMTKLPTVGYGAVFPTFTPITLNGARVDGGLVEYNPGGVFFISATAGTTQKSLQRIDTVRIDTTVYSRYDNSNYSRKLYGARIGYGSKSGERAILSGVYTLDDKSSIALPDSGVTLTPTKNMLMSLDVKVEPIPGIWTIEGEIGGSLTVGDLNAPQFNVDGAPQFLLDLVDSSSSSYFDWAVTGLSSFVLRDIGTKFTANIRRIGSGYRALGVPNLRVDYLRYDLRIDQSFWKRQLSVGVFARQDRDNLIPIKRATSTLFSVGGTLGVTIRRLPYLRLSYAPYVQESDASNPALQYRNRTVMWSAATGYAYQIDNLSASSGITVSRQDAETKDNLYDYRVTSINATQTLGFRIPLSLTASLGYIAQTAVQTLSTSIITTDVSGSYNFSEMFASSAGVSLAFDDTYGTRSGFFLSAQARLWDYADVDLRIERNIFNERLTPAQLGGGYQENIIRFTVGKAW